MKIVKISVLLEDGTIQAWEGTGHVAVRAISKKGQPYQKAVDAHLVLEAGEVIKERDYVD